MSRSAVFLDLDHGILCEPAPEMLSEHLVSPGRDTALRAERIAGALVGPVATRVVARALAGALKGTDVAAFRVAGKAVGSSLRLAPHAHALIVEHRSAGRRLVATTQLPIQSAEPIATVMGFDDVIATHYGATDGVLDGTISGPLVWGRGKLDAVRAWAAENGASLRRSYFYSGAFTDAALLAEVGKPVVCDPDARLAPLAWLKGWPTRSLHAPAGVMRVAGRELQDLIRPFAQPELMANAAVELHSLEHIPSEGPAIVCGNHRSYFDAAVVGLAIAKSGRTARFLGKKEVFDAPLLGAAARWAGGIRVERGTGSDEPLKAAAEALDAGEVIAIMPQGTIPRGPAFFEPELKGRWGAARLAAMTKAPVIPLGVWGTEKVWPRNQRLPRLSPFNRPLVSVQAGPAVPLSHSDPDTDTKAIMSAISDLLPEEAKVRHEPTLEELAATYPSGYEGDPQAEAVRRPGTDT